MIQWNLISKMICFICCSFFFCPAPEIKYERIKLSEVFCDRFGFDDSDWLILHSNKLHNVDSYQNNGFSLLLVFYLSLSNT